MIVHSLLQQMQNDGFGTVNQDLQMGILPLDSKGIPRNGIAVIARGSEVTRVQIGIQNVDFYVRNTNPLKASTKAEELLEYLQDSYSNICDLPELEGYTTESYRNVIIQPTASVEFAGVDENGGHSFVVSGEIRYEKNN